MLKLNTLDLCIPLSRNMTIASVFICFFNRWHLHFIKSAFAGQLPKPYDSGPDATRKIPSHMNDMNREEPSRYVSIFHLRVSKFYS